MSFFPVLSGDVLPLRLQLGGGETGLFPHARVYNIATGAEVAGSPFSLSHLALGLYTANVASLADAKYIAVYRVYTDAGHTILSGVYPSKATDNYEIKTLEAKDATVAKAATAVSNADYTTARAAKIDNLDVVLSTRSTQTSVDAVKTDTAAALTRIGNPVGSSISADVANVQATANTINTKVGTPAGASVSADVAAVKADTALLNTKLTSGRAANLDNLDAQVSLTETLTVAASQTAAIQSSIGTVLSAVQGIQNNTTFTAVVPTVMDIPVAGSETYSFFANLFNTDGAPVDPDASHLTYVVKNTAGTVLQAGAFMTRTSTGVYSGSYTVNAGATENDVVVTFTWAVAAVAFTTYRLSKIAADSGELATLVALLTPQRAANLDNLDVVVSTRLSDASDLTRYNNVLAAEATTQAAVAGVQTKLGTPNAASVSADIAAVRVSTDKIGSPAHTTLAGDTAAIEAKIGTPVATLATDIAAVKADTAVVAVINTKLGTPAGATVSADVAAIKSDTGGLRADVTTSRANLLDNLDAPVSTRATQTTLVAVASDVTTVKADTATLTSRLTAPRAALLDSLTDLDATVTSRASQASLDSLDADVAAVQASVDVLASVTRNPRLIVEALTVIVSDDVIGATVTQNEIIGVIEDVSEVAQA